MPSRTLLSLGKRHWAPGLLAGMPQDFLARGEDSVLQGLALAGDTALGAEHVHPLAPGGRLREQGRTEPVLQRASQEGRGAGGSAQVVTEVTEESVSRLALCNRRRLKSFTKPDVWQEHW